MDTPFSTAKQPCLRKHDQYLQLSNKRISHLSFRYSPSDTSAFSLQAINCGYNGSVKNSKDAASKHFKARLSVGTPSSLSKSPFDDVSRWPLLLYRVVLLVGVGLGSGAPAIAGAPLPTSEVLVKKTVEKATQNTEETSAAKRETVEKVENSTVEKSPQVETKNTGSSDLGDAFWKEMDLSRGSIIAILKSILEGDPNNRDALECLAKNLVDRDDSPHALIVIEKLELLEPNEMEWKYLKAFAYDITGQFQQAKTIYEEILKIEPFSSKAIQGLMMAMDELDEIDALVDVVERTMNKAREENNVIEARNIAMLVGQFYMMKGHLRDAQEHYQEMLEEDDKDFRPHLCLGIIYSALGEKAKAEQQFKAYEKLCPKDYPERKYLDTLMRKAKKEGQKRFEEKQQEKYVRIPRDDKRNASD